jgi:hypothetical protein
MLLEDENGYPAGIRSLNIATSPGATDHIPKIMVLFISFFPTFKTRKSRKIKREETDLLRHFYASGTMAKKIGLTRNRTGVARSEYVSHRRDNNQNRK